MVRESTRAFGAADANTAVAWQSLATVARNDGRLMEAQAAVAQALAIARPLTLRLSARRGLRLMDAVLALDLGRYAQADEALGGLVADAPDAAEQALALRLRAQARLSQGQGELAARWAEQAADLAQQAQDPLEQVLALGVAGRAWALQGQPGLGLASLVEASALLHAPGMAPAPQQNLQLRRFMAEVHLRAGALDPAREALEGAPASAWSAAPALERAHWLDLRGWLATAAGRPGDALAWHAQAAALLAAALPAEHPWRVRNQIYAAWALALKDGRAADRQQARALMQALAQRWTQPSAWTAAAALEGPPLLL